MSSATADMPTLCAAALALPAERLNLPTIESEYAAVDAGATELTLDLPCRGWVASLRLWAPDQPSPLAWQALTALVLQGAQRREAAMTIAQTAYDAALPLGPAGRFAARRAATAMAMAYIQVREHEPSLLWTQRAVDATDPSQPLDPEGALAQTNRATADLMVGGFAQAEKRLVALVDEMRQRPQFRPFHYPMAVAYNQLMYAQAAQARMADALATAAQLVAHRRLHLPADRTGLAVVLGSQGSILRNLGRFDQALAVLREAVEEARAGGSSDAGASGALDQMRSNLANLLLARGQPEQALSLAQEAVAQSQGGARLGALQMVASSQIALGELAAAVTTWREALAIVQAAPPQGESWLRLSVLLSYAQAQLTLGDRAEARRMLDLAEGEAARAPGNLSERGLRLMVLAAVLEQQGQTAAALQALDQAEAFYASQLPALLPQRLELAVRACGLGRGCAALPARLAEGEVPPRLAAAGALVLARERLAAGDGLGAQTQASRALEAALAAAQPLLQWQALAEYARSQSLLQRRTEAIFFGKLAIQGLQQTRSRLAGLGPDADALFLADKLQVYRQLTGWLFDASRLPEGLQVLRLLKRSEQDDFNERAGVLSAAELSLTAREQAWRAQWDAATAAGREQAAEIQRLSRLQAARRITPDEAARLQALTREQAAQSPAARERLQGILSALQAETQTRPAGAAPAERALVVPEPRDGQTLHVYLLAEPKRLRALLVGRGRKQLREQAVSSADLSAGIAALLDAVRQRQDARPPAQALYRHLGPLLDEPARAWGSRRIVVWLDGPLRYLPLGLLHDGRVHLVERYAISVAAPVDAPMGAPAGAPVTSAAPRKGKALQVHAWGVTQALAGLPALPGVGDEICSVVSGPTRGLDVSRCQGALQGQGDVNAYFTEATWRAAGSQDATGGVVHVGTHFVLRPGNVGQSWLLMGDGARLMLDRLRGWPLGAPRLLTLSACETAVPAGQDADGREVDGLAATLLGTGAGQVLASMWRVDDRATAALMRRFYLLAAQQPDDLAGALQTAQREALRDGVPAHAWAAFTLSAAAAR